jgi:protein subunit release factor A
MSLGILSATSCVCILCVQSQKLGWKVELLSSTTQESGGFKEVICQVRVSADIAV